MFKTKKTSIFLKKINATFFLVKQLIVYPSHLVNHLLNSLFTLHVLYNVHYVTKQVYCDSWNSKSLQRKWQEIFFFFIFCLIANLRSLFQQQFGTYGLLDFWKMWRLHIVWKRLNGCRTFPANHLHSRVGCSNILSKPNIINLN